MGVVGVAAAPDDELGGAAASPGCADGSEHLPLGALWFYDVSNPATPIVRSSYSIPQQEVTVFCTAHNFNTVPTRNGRDVLVSAWYNGGTTVLELARSGASVDGVVSTVNSLPLDNIDPPLLEILLPVGISFYTFQTISYSVDVFRRRIPPVNSFLDFG